MIDKRMDNTHAVSHSAFLHCSFQATLDKVWDDHPHGGKIGKICGQEKEVTTFNLARMNMLLHGFHYLSGSGTMAIILLHGVLFRGGAEASIQQKLITDDNIDCIIGLPANLFYSTSIPVCIIVLKKCRKSDDELFINEAEHCSKDQKQNALKRTATST